jgi:3',5'-cyclic AMP phosphodiesterase CpdA
MILGKPGAGKTTFLKNIAVKCQKGEFLPELIPIFISLKDFSEEIGNKFLGSRKTLFLQDYVSREFLHDCDLNQEQTEIILKQGKALILLDGLDEVTNKYDDEFNKEICSFISRFYRNRFIITCRIATRKYRFQKENFNEVEVADFNPKQVKAFIYQWFAAFNRTSSDAGRTIAGKFMEKLNLPENKAIRELVVTPILLNLICLVFQGNAADFPSERAELYRQGLHILLFRWDQERKIERDEVYRNLSVLHKEQLLSRLASETFKQGDYFFKQDKIQKIFAEELPKLLGSQPEPIQLQKDSGAVLKSIEVQHGLLIERAREIYSFSHLTFQEYFTAKKFINHPNSGILKPLFTDWNGRWHEVFLLVARMLQTADDFLRLKPAIDELLASDEKLQQFLEWVNQKSLSSQINYKPAGVRAFYFGLAFSNLSSTNQLDFSLSRCLDPSLDTLQQLQNLKQEKGIFNQQILVNIKRLVKRLISIIILVFKDQNNNELVQYQEEANRSFQDWAEQLKAVMIGHRNIGHDWQFNDDQKTSLQAYYFANLLLVELLNSNQGISPEVREKIESTLLLPVAKDDAKVDNRQCKQSNLSQFAQTSRACSLMHILHLSDLHFGTPENARNWYNQLAEDVIQELDCPRLDALILSGDIANKSTLEEYTAAKQFLDNLCQEFQLQPEQIVIVPGNHDLNWGLAKKAYKLVDLDEFEGELKEGYYIQESQSVIRIRDEKKYKQRFANFCNFYQAITGKPYPLEYEQQGIVHHFPEQNFLILGLNSAWQLDHHYKSRASINADAINKALTDIRRNQAYKDCLKIAVWHHPLTSAFEDRITDHGFMEQLAKAGFRFALHGHIHKAETTLFKYDMSAGGRKLDIICAGTFGAPVREWVPGYPLQYNLLKFEDNKLTVNTRRREELNGAWKPDARWLMGAGQNPLPYYEVPLFAA